jgi:hypothetical protein
LGDSPAKLREDREKEFASRPSKTTMLLQLIFAPHLSPKLLNLLKYEVTGLGDGSREIEVRF